MSDAISFTPEEKTLLTDKIKRYFEQELDQEIGTFDAEFLLDFFSREVGAHFYNRGLYDALEALRAKLDLIADDVGYTLEKPIEA